MNFRNLHWTKLLSVYIIYQGYGPLTLYTCSNFLEFHTWVSVKSGEGVTTFVVHRHCFALSCCIPTPDFPSLYSPWDVYSSDWQS